VATSPTRAWLTRGGRSSSQEAAKEEEARAAALARFHSQNHGAGKWEDVKEEGAQASSSGVGSAASAAGTDFERKQQKEMKAYWLPSKTPEAKKIVDKPDTATKCPCVRFPPLPRLHQQRSCDTLTRWLQAHVLYRPCVWVHRRHVDGAQVLSERAGWSRRARICV